MFGRFPNNYTNTLVLFQIFLIKKGNVFNVHNQLLMHLTQEQEGE